MHKNKVVIVVRDDLKTWQKLNVTAFLSGAVAIAFPELRGRHLTTASGNNYMPFFKQPVLIYKAENAEQIKRCFNRARERELGTGIYPSPLFTTNNEADNLTETAKYTEDELDLAGIALYGDAKKVSKAIDGLKFHD